MLILIISYIALYTIVKVARRCFRLCSALPKNLNKCAIIESGTITCIYQYNGFSAVAVVREGLGGQ